MYQEQELEVLEAQLKKRWLLTLIPIALLLAGIVVAIIQRNETAADVLSILLGSVLIFSWSMFLSPIRKYARYVDGMLHGRQREAEGDWKGIEEESSMVDGVRCHALYIVCLDDKQKPYDRLFYLDAEKPKPSFREGQRVRVTYHDRGVIRVEAV